jgi:hypothetical protein
MSSLVFVVSSKENKEFKKIKAFGSYFNGSKSAGHWWLTPVNLKSPHLNQ